MVSILDNKKVSELVVENEDGSYQKINPETLATIVEDVSKSDTAVSQSVQDHMNDSSIHLTKVDVEQITKDCLEVSDLVAGSAITINHVPNTNQLVISATDFNNVGFITVDDVIPEDDSITITKNPNGDDFKIRANIPDVSKMIKQRNIKSGDIGITVKYDEESNDVYLYGEGGQYNIGEGLELVNGVITNIAPDKEITINGGTNVTVEGSYPNFTINSSDVVSISDWKVSTNYKIDDMVVYNDSLLRCIETHTSGQAFESDKWKLIAGWFSDRQYFYIDEPTADIVLKDEINDKNVLIINIGGIVQQSLTYDLQPDNKTIRFIEELPTDSIVEVITMSHVVMDSYDTNVNINPWEVNTSYAKDNIVIYNNSLYQCLERHISSQTFEKDKWQLICGYSKTNYLFELSAETSEITLPVYVADKSMLTINVNNSILQSSEYDLEDTGYKIVFNPSLNANDSVEIVVNDSSIIQLPEIPTIDGNANYFLTTDEKGQKYILRSVEETLELTGLKTLLEYSDNPDSIVTVNPQGTGYKYISFNDLTNRVKGGQLIEGLEISSPNNSSIRVNTGSTIDSTNSLLLELGSVITKDVTSKWTQGYSKGSAIGSDLEDWVQPIMTTNLTNGYQIFTSDYITDREGWRAMDGKSTEGNGWLVNGSQAIFSLECPEEIVLNGFDFYNTDSGSSNHSKEIDIWIGSQDNVIRSFTAENEDYGYTHVDIVNDVASKTVGFTIKSSYGNIVGAKEIKFIAKAQSYFVRNHSYYVYLLSDNNGNATDIATSLYNINEFANNLPSVYSKFALIGSYSIDNLYNIVNCFPTKELRNDWISGTLNGTVYSNSIETRMYDDVKGKPVIILEQFGETIPSNGYIEFPQSFSQILYVQANGEKIVSKDEKGFEVQTSETVNWIAKGYKY